MRGIGVLVAVWIQVSPAGAQLFVDGSADIPQGPLVNASHSENVDFADVDLDGDWDAVFADGGDSGDDQNRLWINSGGLQGGTEGVFVDETVTRFPSLLDDSRDVEFADIDGDGDADLYVSNTSTITNQTNRWLVNQGRRRSERRGSSPTSRRRAGSASAARAPRSRRPRSSPAAGSSTGPATATSATSTPTATSTSCTRPTATRSTGWLRRGSS